MKVVMLLLKNLLKKLHHNNKIRLCILLQIPPEFDIDSDALSDHTQTPEYAKDIFDYLKKSEVSLGVFTAS